VRIWSSTLALAVLLAACGGSSTSSRIESKLQEHLTERNLSVKWVRCAAARESVYRCNVNFGDPHVQIYCAAMIDGELRAAEWRQAVHGRQDRAAAARECAARLGS
jgi:hypothetical protein